MSGIHEFIDNEIKSNDVVLFMKGTPQFPQCGFSGQVVQILDYIGVDYKGVNVLITSASTTRASTCLPIRKSARASRNTPTGRQSRSFT